MLLRTPARAGTRRGVILLVVLALLTLFAILGLSFVTYSDASATSARVYREVQTRNRFGGNAELGITLPEATALWSSFLGQLIYDLNDDRFGAYSVLRGHSLARTMYGWDDSGAANDRPYAGTGRLRESGIGVPFAETEFAVNYQWGPGKVLRDPGRLGARAQLTDARGPLTGDLHVSYTYADHNNLFLAVINPADGRVLVPSYHRPWIGGPLNTTNPNWTNADGRYKLMRPRPADMGAGFPAPASATGDVKNLDRVPGGHDSIWIDVNSPVVQLPDGRKFKMLIAPLIIELDGRINVNTAGNVMGNSATTGRFHASNQGWGPWEVNLSRVLNASNRSSEWRNLFFGNGSIAGKYGSGPNALPRGAAVLSGPPIRGYYPIDYNAVVGTTPGALTGRYAFTALQLFPTFPVAYQNGMPRETTSDGTPTGSPNHASIYNPLRPHFGNRNFGVDDTVSSLRRLDSSGPIVTSDLSDLLPVNFADRQRRNLITADSYDLDRPGSPPYVWDPNPADASQRYRHDRATGIATGPALSFPDLSQRTTITPPPGSEFDASWRSTLASLPRLDLHRKLTDYPTNDPAELPTTGAGAWQYTAAGRAKARQALRDRQALAADIYARLWRVTGAVPTTTLATYAPDSPEFRAHRWLAQLAVNIVDFIDHDDHVTPFQFHPNQWVYGTEIPRLVINEYFAQWDNDPVNGLTTGPNPVARNVNRVNVWAELHNPFPREQASQDPAQGDARLQNDSYPVYRLLLCDRPNAGIRSPENVLGTPDLPGNVVGTVDTWGLGPWIVQPGFQRYSALDNPNPSKNNGFYLVGPAVNAAGATAYPPVLSAIQPLPDTLPTIRSQDLSFALALTTNPTPVALPGSPSQQPSLLLQRLANPYLPPQPNPAQPDHNPYLTIDHVDQLTVHDGRLFDMNGRIAPAVGLQNRRSQGRWHPFAATQWRAQDPLGPVAANEARHTFFRHNAREQTRPASFSGGNTIQVPFDAFVHPDRQLTSIAELMHVSALKPHELTQQFMAFNATSNTLLRFGHRAPWARQDTRIYRLWDHLTLRSWGGRIPGRVNVNAINHPLILEALADGAATATSGPTQFTNAEVAPIYARLIAQRTPGSLPGPNSRPYKSMGSGYAITPDAMTHVSAPNRGIHETLLRNHQGTATLATDQTEWRMLEPLTNLGAPPRDQALTRFELLAKVYGHLTTRSHVFGVWATVGFFEVLDDTVMPVKLGREMAWPTNGIIRHRMFALVDRSQLQLWPTMHNYEPLARLLAPVTAAGQQTVTLANVAGQAITSVTHPFTGRTWNLRAGAYLTIDPDTDDEETVQVEAVRGSQFQATFTRQHTNGVVVSRGNPGPWPKYDVHSDTAVVPFWMVLE